MRHPPWARKRSQLTLNRARRRASGRPKSEAPRAALPAEASAPPGATSVEGDPPPIDCPALAFSPTNVIARQSLRSGGRSLCWLLSPVTRFLPQRETPRAWPPPVTRLRTCRAGCRCLCPVSQVSSPTPHRLPRRFAMWTRNHPPTVPLCHVHPVGPPLPLDRHCWLSRLVGTVPRAPVGMRYPVRRTL